MTKATDKLKGTYVHIMRKDDLEKVVEIYTKMGFLLLGGESIQEGMYSMQVYACQFTGVFLFVNKENRVSYGVKNYYEHFEYSYKPVTISEVEAIFTEHKEEKRKAKRNSRLRKKGWKENTGDMPTGYVDIIFGDGSRIVNISPIQWYWDIGKSYSIEFWRLHKEEVNMKSKWAKWEATDKSVYPGNPDDVVEVVWGDEKYKGAAWEFVWYTCLDGSTIRKYRVITPASVPEPTEKVVSLEDMVTSVAADLGKEVVVMENIDTNPKKKFGDKSIPLNLWSPLASAYGAVSLYNGALKYGRGNYKATPVEASIYIAAALRHLLAWAEGEEFDPADGCPNLGGVLANIAILLDSRAVGMMIDDRQISGGYLKEREMLKEIVGKLQILHADKDPRHYTIKDSK